MTQGKRRQRKPYAWERHVVKSSIPHGEQQVACARCKTTLQRKELKQGYCPTCWQG